MRLFFRCMVLFIAVWISWHFVSVLSVGRLGIETINEGFLRVFHHFTVWPLIRDILLFLSAQLLLLLALSWFAFLGARGVKQLVTISDWMASFSSVGILVILLHLFNSLLFPVSATASPSRKLGRIL